MRLPISLTTDGGTATIMAGEDETKNPGFIGSLINMTPTNYYNIMVTVLRDKVKLSVFIYIYIRVIIITEAETNTYRVSGIPVCMVFLQLRPSHNRFIKRPPTKLTPPLV